MPFCEKYGIILEKLHENTFLLSISDLYAFSERSQGKRMWKYYSFKEESL